MSGLTIITSARTTLVVARGATRTVVIRARPIIYRESVPSPRPLKSFSPAVVPGQLAYALPVLPSGAVLATLNGQQVDVEVDGVNVTLQGYTPGSIDAADVIRFFYTE